MGAWSPESRTHVSTMSDGDFRSTEKSVTVESADDVRIEHVAADGTVTVLKAVDAAAGRRGDRRRRDAQGRPRRSSSPSRSPTPRQQDVLYSVHLKATMMKVSDPIIFGHGVGPSSVESCSSKYDDASPNDGLASLLDEHPEAKAEVDAALAAGPDLFMVDSDNGRHQPARAQRRDRRRLDAGADPRFGPGLECGRRAAGHEVRDS